jgi:hypothetical protein
MPLSSFEPGSKPGTRADCLRERNGGILSYLALPPSIQAQPQKEIEKNSSPSKRPWSSLVTADTKDPGYIAERLHENQLPHSGQRSPTICTTAMSNDSENLWSFMDTGIHPQDLDGIVESI